MEKETKELIEELISVLEEKLRSDTELHYATHIFEPDILGEDMYDKYGRTWGKFDKQLIDQAKYHVNNS